MFRVEIIVGRELDKDNVRIRDAYTRAKDALSLLSGVFGGCTLIESKGAWKDPKGELVREDGFIFRIDGVSAEDIQKARVAAHDIRILFNQSSVVFTVIEASTEFI